MDIWHKVTKFIDHNRYISLAGLSSTVLMLPACFPQIDGKAVGPVSGELVSGDELEAEVLREQSSLREQYDENERAIAGLEQQQAALVRESEILAVAAGEAIEQIEEENASRNALFGEIVTIASAAFPASQPVLGPLSGFAGLLIGGGALADSRRKNKIIKQLKPS